MAKHFSIVINVSYDETSITDDMDLECELNENVQRCIECAQLLNDFDMKAIVEDCNYHVVSK